MKFLEWLRPGMRVKRFLLLCVAGVVSISYGLSYFANIYGNMLGYILSAFLIIAGGILIIFGVRYAIKSIINSLPKGSFRMFLDNEKLSNLMYEKRILVKGPKIVTIGGGTGLSNLLRGLKRYSSNITAIVTVADDGGGSGILRDEIGMAPPGDIRNCILALADTEPIMEEILQYRFSDGSLKGQSFGNLFLAALHGISENFEEAVQKMGDVLAVTGKVLPVSKSDIRISAELEDGSIIEGESNIGERESKKFSRIKKIFMQNDDVEALPDAIASIKEADVIVFASGSLYTSIIPNIIVPGLSEEIMLSDAIKIYTCNIMTQPNETEGYKVSDHIKAIEEHSYKGIVEYCLANNTSIPTDIDKKYKSERSRMVEIDRKVVSKMNVRMIEDDFVSFEGGLIRHDSDKITSAIIQLVADKVLENDRKRVIDYYYVRDRLQGRR